MKPSQLNPGDLIRYSVTNSRWHFGTVREVDGDSVELEYFWGAVESVPLESVTLPPLSSVSSLIVPPRTY